MGILAAPAQLFLFPAPDSSQGSGTAVVRTGENGGTAGKNSCRDTRVSPTLTQCHFYFSLPLGQTSGVPKSSPAPGFVSPGGSREPWQGWSRFADSGSVLCRWLSAAH